MSLETVQRVYRGSMWLTRLLAVQEGFLCTARLRLSWYQAKTTLRGEVSLVHGVDSHVSPRSLRQNLGYQVWEGKDGSTLLHRSSEGLLARVRTDLQYSELGMRLFQGKWKK